MLLKPGVDITHLARPLRRALQKIDVMYPDFVITSTRHDSHGASSLHYADQAIDIRLTAWGGKVISVEALRRILGDDFDVVGERTHIHVEFDPKP